MSSRRFPVLLGLALAACEPVEDPPAPAPDPETSGTAIFEERARDFGLDFRHSSGATGKLYFPEPVPPGVALLDYDHDGDLDVYLAQGGSAAGGEPGWRLPGDRLFRSDLAILDDGTVEPRFVDVTRAAGLGAGHYGMGVATADVDGDGDLDLYATRLGPNQLWINRGDGTFREQAAAAGVDDRRWNTSASFFDYDRDGRQDLFVVCYKNWSPAAEKPCYNAAGATDYCGPGAFVSAADRLYRNLGGGRFEDVSERAGLLLHYGAGLGVLTGDFDGNGWPDVYVANDKEVNFLWVNRGDGTFVERALLAGTAVNKDGLAEGSMGVDAGDGDGDGDLDLFVTHFRDETNTFYLNEGRGLFRDATHAVGLGRAGQPLTAFGTAFLDYDNDGWLDLAVTNGSTNVDEARRLAGEPLPVRHEPNQLYRNAGGRFEDVSAQASAAFLEPAVGRGLAAGDVDEDGDPDLVVANAEGPARLFVNRVGHRRSWLGVRTLAAGLAPAPAVELRVERDGGAPLYRVTRSDGSYLSARDPRALFGLAAGAPRRLEITWPGGRRERWRLAVEGRYLVFSDRRSTGP